MTQLWRLSDDAYRGLPIHCAPGVHAAALELLAPKVSRSARWLDLASGSGALLARLKDAGFHNLFAAERDISSYQLPDVPCRSVDLDKPFAIEVDGPYDVVTAIEIIEHLSNPLAFLREIRLVLKPGGYALVSTPNVSEWKSRAKFLLTGHLRYFDEKQYSYQRHFSPILPALVPAMFAEAGLQLVLVQTCGTHDGPLKQWTVGAAIATYSALSGDRFVAGECLLMLARRSITISDATP